MAESGRSPYGSAAGCACRLAALGLSALPPPTSRPKTPDQRSGDIADDRQTNGDRENAHSNRAGCLVNPDEQPAELTRKTLGVGGIHDPRVMVKLPGADAISRIIERRNCQRIDDEREEGGDRDIRPRGNC